MAIPQLNAIQFFLVYNFIPLALPVNPESFKITHEGLNEQHEVVNMGEINVLRGLKLRDLTIESFLPSSNEQPWVNKGALGIQSALPAVISNTALKIVIETMRNSQKTATLLITGLGIFMEVSIEEFSTEYKAGEEGDEYYTLHLREYKDTTIPMGTIDGNAFKIANDAGTLRRVVTMAKQSTWMVKAGESITGISKLALGDADSWKGIFDLNSMAIGVDPSVLPVGTTLQLPK